MTLCDICKKEVNIYGNVSCVLETGETVHKSCLENWQKSHDEFYRNYNTR